MRILMVTPQRITARCGVSDYAIGLARHLMASKIPVGMFSPANKRAWTFPAVMREFKADAVHLHYHRDDFKANLGPVLMGMMCRTMSVPLVTTFHNLPWKHEEGRDTAQQAGIGDGLRAGESTQATVLSKILFTCPHQLLFTNLVDIKEAIAVSPSFEDRMDIALVGAGRECVLPDDFHRESIRHSLGFDEKDTVLTYFGFLRPGKGVETLLAALRLLLDDGHQCRILLVGDVHSDPESTEVNYAETIRRTVENGGLAAHVTMMGYLHPDEVSCVLAAGDIGVLPFDEGLSHRRSSFFTLTEHGLPTVSTRGKMSRGDLIDAAAPFLVRPCEPRALAERVAGYITAPAVLEKDTKQLLDYLERYHSWHAIVMHHMSIYEEVLEKSTRRDRAVLNENT